jgi:hypothetical protein
MWHLISTFGLLARKYAVTLSPETAGVSLKNLSERGGRTVGEIYRLKRETRGGEVRRMSVGEISWMKGERK